MQLQLIIIGALAMTTMAQRSSFAGGIRGSGYKDGLLQQTASNSNSVNNNNNDLVGNRNADDIGTPARIPPNGFNSNLPVDARGDAYLVNHYNTLPADHRPFWLLNQHHIEAQRGTPSNRGTRPSPSSSTNQFSAQDFPTRFNDDLGGSNSFSRPSGNNNNINITPQSGIVYPVNTAPEQQLSTEIQLLQQRLNSLMQIQNQLQQRNQNQRFR